MIIHLIRHTRPDIQPGICYGQTDLDLADTFEIESEHVVGKLFAHYDAIYTSPLQRCARLSKKLTSNAIVQDSRIMEYNFGDWELLAWNDFKSNAAQHWMNNFVEQAAPNGDSLLTMRARVIEFWTELLEKNLETVAIVTHSGVQRLIHGLILDTPMEHLFRLQLDFGAILEVNSNLNSGLITVKHL
jgi:alpha-ribazole phosphatase